MAETLSPIAEESHKPGSGSRASVLSEKSDTAQQGEVLEPREETCAVPAPSPACIVVPARKKERTRAKMEFKASERLRLSMWNLERALAQEPRPSLGGPEGLRAKVRRLQDLVM